jgi:AraC-like DNA-binding protein
MTRISIYMLEQWQKNASKSAYQAKAMAAFMGISPRQLERWMALVFHCRPHDWLHEQRFLKAAVQLKGGLPVKNVASELGFKQASNFSREFKRVYGRSPRAFLDWDIPNHTCTRLIFIQTTEHGDGVYFSEAPGKRKLVFEQPCGGKIQFSSHNLCRKIPCPLCRTALTLRAPENLKISCSFCQEHIEFPPYAIGEKISCPQCAMAVVLKEPG